jgi:hypothetical protein
VLLLRAGKRERERGRGKEKWRVEEVS